ncbi:MAG: exodeoxyribonuclease VII large subunit, partial [Acidobacteria bacterium]|nr:exodeoxyribonuclease VII large subunit [Acidobacteriota bacterium]
MPSDPLFAGARARRALSVTQLTGQIKELLENGFFDIWVQGEISNFKAHSSGHWYLTLKDAQSQLQAVCFRMQNRLIRFRPEDGLEVFARGRISVYEKRGEYRLLIEYLEPVGVGSLQLAFEQLKARLEAEGLFRTDRKRELPLVPSRVGVVTSPSGAALRDILRVLMRRNSGVDVCIAPVRVQGEGAAAEIADAIRLLNGKEGKEGREGVDVIIVARGGGSIEDLWAFNEEAVARAIFQSRAPVISAVGHETDFTIADFVADVRAATPSAAAEQVAAGKDQLIERFFALEQNMTRAFRYRIATARERVSLLLARRGLDRASRSLQEHVQRLDDLSHRMEMACSRYLGRLEDRLGAVLQGLARLRFRERLAQTRGQLDVGYSRLALLMQRRRLRDHHRV